MKTLSNKKDYGSLTPVNFSRRDLLDAVCFAVGMIVVSVGILMLINVFAPPSMEMLHPASFGVLR